MATTQQIMENFLWGHDKGRASNLYIKDGRLINFNTVIAQRIDGRVVVNTTAYSVTTKRHQNRLLRSMPDVQTVDNIPMGTWDLLKYLA